MIVKNDTQKHSKSKRVTPESGIIGRNLRLLRERAGLTQKELAAILGITFQQVQKYERGENRFPVDKLFILKNHLAVPYQAFFAGLEKAEEEANFNAMLARASPAVQDRIRRVALIMME